MLFRSAHRTYRYSSAEPLYPFGFGLSYSQFEYSDLRLDKTTLAIGDSLRLSVTLTNSGDRTAPEVAQFYLSDLQASTLVPRCHLIGFERVVLNPGEFRTLSFTVTPEMMSFFNDDGQLTLEPGQFRLEIGGCYPSPRGLALGAPRPVTTTFELK